MLPAPQGLEVMPRFQALYLLGRFHHRSSLVAAHVGGVLPR
jgi:hypothetical protein